MRSPRYTPPVERWAARKNTRKLLQSLHTPNETRTPGVTVIDVRKQSTSRTSTRTANVKAKNTTTKPLPKREARLKAKSGDLTETEIAETIEAYNPRRRRPMICSQDLWEREEANIKRLVAEAAANDPEIPIAASLSALTMLLVWAEKEELGLSAEAALTGQHIDTFAASLDRAGASRRYVLRRLAIASNVAITASMITIGKTPLQAPYTDEEIRTLLAHAEALTNEHRKRLLIAIIGLGAGVGLVRGAQRGVCKNALHHHSGTSKHDSPHNNTPLQETLHLKHNGICRPVHPLLSSALLALEDDGEAFISLGLGKNYLSRASTLLKKSPGTPLISADRLRAFYVTWILSIGLPLKDTLLILDLKKPGSLQAYLEFLPETKKACDE